MTMAAPPSRTLRTIEYAALQLSCTPRMILKLARQQKLELVKFGNSARITERSLNALVDEILVGDAPPLRDKDDE